MLDFTLSHIDSLCVLHAGARKLFDFLLGCRFLLHRCLDVRHRFRRFFLSFGKLHLFTLCFLCQLVNSHFGFIELLKTRKQMLALASRGSHDSNQDFAETLDKVDKDLRRRHKVPRRMNV